ncbi:MAG: calcium:proton antiporter [Bauldia sp.]|uniref:calcium:proton antiporter n=1 Tax=Bauldia sp. TaxID=2575872 RepID=UPI001DF89182|nr:calcium:proton antiporter [Bauldia sp.]MCB1495909.1 calcium:proton antiporter [Bauldia sp.]
MLSLIRSEAAFIVGAVTTVILMTVGAPWFYRLDNPLILIGLFVWVFVVMVRCAFGVVRHADSLAELLGEPYGTLILTISVIGIEVSVIAALMLNGNAEPTLARDTMLAVVIIVMNGMVGLSLLVGGFRHKEQEYNLQGARAFLGVLLTLATVSLILPNFTTSTPDGSLTPLQSILFASMTLALYATFLGLQTTRHRAYFDQPTAAAAGSGAPGEDDHKKHHDLEVRSVPYHAVFLILTLLPIVLLSKKLAALIDFGLDAFSLPHALGGVLVAILVLTPEGVAALKAAALNHLQRSVNICLGSALATISLTVPAVVAIGLLTGTHVELGLEGTEMVLLILTLTLSILTFGATRTNMLQGAVHLVVFFVYFVLIFDP